MQRRKPKTPSSLSESWQLNLALVDEYQPPSEEEVSILFDILFSYPVHLVRPFLQQHKLPTSLIKEALRKRIENALEDERVTIPELVHSVNTLEGWGNQHIYFYKSQQTEDWLSEQKGKEKLRKRKLLFLHNRLNPIILPAEPTLSSINVTSDRLRIQWVEKREWVQRVPEQDRKEGEYLLRGYRPRVARAITTFDWDLITGNALLMIQRLHSGNNYAEFRTHYEKELEPIVGISGFERIRILPSMLRNLEASDEVRKRSCQREAEGGEVITITSRSRAYDVYYDPGFSRIFDVIGVSSIPRQGNYYWQAVDGKLDRDIHVKVYPQDYRVGIFGACTESEVRYLLSRIRHYCK